ncbi:unnamed protein product [Calypogeia fissa]
MVQMTEFRVVMPLSIEEFRIAQMYMVTRIQEQQTSGSEGVEVLVNKAFDNQEFGTGQYTSKIYRMQSKAPSWVAAIAPTNALVIEEEAWNAYPKCKTILKCPYFPKFKLTIETMHVADSGETSNALNLSKSALSSRKVETIDIASHPQDYWSYVIGGDAVDLTTFKSKKTGRGPLLPGWQETSKPVMTAYKVVTVDAPYWGFGYRLEQLLLSGERALFAESHKQCVSWIDEWFGLTYNDVRKLELQMDETLKLAMAQCGIAQLEVSKSAMNSKVGDNRNEDLMSPSQNDDGKDDGQEAQPVESSQTNFSQQQQQQGRLGVDSGLDRNFSKVVSVMI